MSVRTSDAQFTPADRQGAGWSRIVSHLFFLFFTSPILSPYIAERTLYLYWVIPLLDPAFFGYLLTRARRADAETWLATGVFLTWLLAVAPESCLRWVMILWPLAYLGFARDRGIFSLYFWTGVNVVVALVQAATYWTLGPAMAMLVGPKNIAELLWGSLATRSFTNFYSIIPGFDFPRFSGLSREGGFFAALLAVVALLRVAERRRFDPLLAIGVVLSISKSTVFLAVGWLLAAIGAKDKRTPVLLFIPILVALCLVFLLSVDGPLMEGRLSPTFSQRLYPYAALLHDMDLPTILVGHNASATTLAQYKSFQLCANVESYQNCLEMPSFAALVYYTGVVGLCLYLWQLAVLGTRLWGILLVFVLTSTVAPLSDTSFVVLSYFLALRVSRAERTEVVAESAGGIGAVLGARR